MAAKRKVSRLRGVDRVQDAKTEIRQSLELARRSKRAGDDDAACAYALDAAIASGSLSALSSYHAGRSREERMKKTVRRFCKCASR